MKLLLAVHNFPPEFRGGVERAVEALSTQLLANGLEVMVVTGSAEVRADDAPAEFICEEWRGVPVRRWQRAGGYHNFVDAHDPQFEAAFETLLAEFRPDVLHLHHWSQLSTGLCALAKRQGIPSLATLHDHWITCARYFRLPQDVLCEKMEAADPCIPCLQQVWGVDESELGFALAMRQASCDQELSLLSALTVSSQSHLDLLRRFGRYPEAIWEKFRVLPMGTSPAGPNRKTLPLKDRRDRFVVAHWGNLNALKGVEVLAKAAALAKLEHLELRFLGRTVEPGLEDRLVQLAGDRSVSFGGAYDPENLAELLADVDCAVFPSLAHETHSLVADEAMELGLPLIVSDRGAPAERVAGRGLIVPANDEAALATALEKMADPGFRKTCLESKAGLVSLEDWTVQMQGIYAEVAVDRQSERAPDLTRERLAHRNQRLAEIAQYVGGQSQQRSTLEQAILGDEAALKQLAEFAPQIAQRIEDMNAVERKEGS
ncbi:MAG: glycosyltransferase [Planctomycetota bacterium]